MNTSSLNVSNEKKIHLKSSLVTLHVHLRFSTVCVNCSIGFSLRHVMFLQPAQTLCKIVGEVEARVQRSPLYVECGLCIICEKKIYSIIQFEDTIYECLPRLSKPHVTLSYLFLLCFIYVRLSATSVCWDICAFSLLPGHIFCFLFVCLLFALCTRCNTFRCCNCLSFS